jgi:hypothetical protein
LLILLINLIPYVMAFNGTEGSPISPEQAGEWTQNWRNNNARAKKAVFFGRAQIENLLSQTGCMGIRMYFATNNSGEQTLVLVGANNKEDDMSELVIDSGILCPPRCGVSNALNGN